ncbi:MAG: MtrAB system histidine kinase MtrB [Carbonactinosporaceae bacterium]
MVTGQLAAAARGVSSAGAWAYRAVGDLLRAGAAVWRSSLHVRVVATTLLLSVAVVAFIGVALLNRVTDGLLQGKTEAALAQANAGFLRAQQQVAGGGVEQAGGTEPDQVPQQLTKLVGELAQSGGGGELYEVVLLSTDPQGSGPVGGRAPRASGLILPESVPPDLRQALERSDAVAYRLVELRYDDSRRAPGLAVGAQVFVPNASGYYQLFYLFPLTQEQATVGLLRRATVGAGSFLVVLLGIIAWLVTRQVVSPVRMAARISERLAAGRLEERMRVEGEDEIARLASSFNKMASNLQRQIHQLEELSRVQRRFVSDVSHELRTPLTTVRMAADVLHESRHAFDPAVARSTELLQAQLDRFEALLTDLLEISRFDAGAAVLDAEPIDVRDLVQRVVETAGPIAERSGTTLLVREARAGCVAEVDPRRIERVIRNLVINAIEHGEGEKVVVRIAANATAVAVAVRDHGVGLKPGETSLVFNRFWRSDPARARSCGGSGLGLSIALEDAHLHGGWLQAWGEPGDGSQFRLTLPRTAGGEIDRSPTPLEPDDSRHRAGGPGATPGGGYSPVAGFGGSRVR